MKSTAINNIKYTGIVTISQYKQGKKFEIIKIHNAGAEPLFNFFAHCLCGDYTTAEILRPKKIKLFNDDNPDSVYECSDEIFASAVEKLGWLPNGGNGVRYSFLVHRDSIYTSNTGNFNKIGLYCLSENNVINYSAVVEVSPEDVAEMRQSDVSVLLIDWDLQISNTN